MLSSDISWFQVIVDCCTKPILEWIAESCPRAIVNVMGQYRPEYLVAKNPTDYSKIASCPTSKELEEAQDHANELDLVCLT